MSNVFNVVLLTALPASGKSEVRNFMANIEPKRLQEEFHIGANLQLDDFPYVHFMRLIDMELDKLNMPRIYYPSNELPFYDAKDWGTLTHLLNEDYHDMIAKNTAAPADPAQYLFDRLDRASLAAGLKPRMALLSDEVRAKISEALCKEAQKIIDTKQNQYPDTFEDKTIIIEFARGGADGSSMPLTGAYGYQYTLNELSPDLLEHSAVLYIWVSPEESRRKNSARANPDDPGSNLFHGVPMPVMLGDYGCDDMEYLIEHTEKENTITVTSAGKKFHLPIGVFDNRVDKTSYLRRDKSEWSDAEVEEMTIAIRKATDAMWSNYKK